MDMLVASIAGDPRITIDDCEIRRAGVSYTIDTLRDIMTRYHPEGKLGLIMGDDLAADFHRWRQAADIIALADIIIAHRAAAGTVDFPYPHTWLNNEIMEISSALVRERIQQGAHWRYLVPAAARHIIEDRLLYGYTPPGGLRVPGASVPHGLMVRVEEAARSAVSASRFLHSRNTALLCWDLCLRFGLDPKAGYLAGIAHDMCKSCSEEELLSLARSDGEEISKLERKKPGLLHARAAAVLLAQDFDIHDRDILEAVRLHTTGGMDMGALAKVVYIADKIEVSRENMDPGLRELSRTADLDRLFRAVLDNIVAYLRSRKLDISEGTMRLLEAMERKKL
jgi:nicotinate-nucleotide adenylyltransferase